MTKNMWKFPKVCNFRDRPSDIYHSAIEWWRLGKEVDKTVFIGEGLFQSLPNLFVSVWLFHRDNLWLRSKSVEGMYQSRNQILQSKTSKRYSPCFGGFWKPHVHTGLWSGEGVGRTGTLHAQHKEAAACSFMGKVLLILGCFFSSERGCVCTNSIHKCPARKGYLLLRPPCI